MHDFLRHTHIPSELGFEFLDVFSRMEYALKATGSYALKKGKGVDPWWDKFANHIDQAFRSIKDDELSAAVEYLHARPPRKQTVQNGKIEFIDNNFHLDQTKTRQTLLIVRAVRNNLFHGGKILP